jgi:hypothetical protein
LYFAVEEKDHLEEMVASFTNHLTIDIVQGGGEAPAPAIESSDELATSVRRNLKHHIFFFFFLTKF